MAPRRPVMQQPDEAAPPDDSQSWGVHVPADQQSAAHNTQFPIAEPTAADRVAAMLGEVSDDERAVVKLYREVSTGKMEWCDDYSPMEFEAGGQRMIREKWGHGRYDVRLYATLPGGGFGIRARDSLIIALSRDAPAPTHGTNSEIGRALQALAENQAAMLRAITERPPAPDPMAQFGVMLGMVAKLKGALGLDAPSQKTTLGEIVAAARELREVSGEFNPSAEPADPMMAALPSIVGLLQKAIESKATQAPQALPVAPVALPRSLTPAKAPARVVTGNDSAPRPAAPVYTVAPKETPAGIPGAVAFPAKSADALGASPTDDAPRFGEIVVDFSNENPEGEPMNGTPAPAPTDDADDAGEEIDFLALLTEIVNRAERADDVGEAAEYVYASVPDEVLPLIGNPGWFPQFAQIVAAQSPELGARMQAHPLWFDLLGKAVKRIFNEETGKAD